ncbi:MAG TPA: hypothetical protein VFZ34_10770, partial [Blastocatellia bacterium]|nr:hypothetical protein [Blastocatellia bacterium]
MRNPCLTNKLFPTVFFLTILILRASAQTPPPPPPPLSPPPLSQPGDIAPKPVGAQPVTDFALLEEAIARIPSLRNEENQIRLLSKAAELWWDKDEKRARELFTRAQGILVKWFQTPPQPHELEDGASGFDTRALRELRTELIRRVAARDGRMAWALMQATRTEPSEKDSGFQEQEESQIQASLIPDLVRSDPHFAVQKAEEQLARNGALDFSSTLRLLLDKDPEAAKQLARAILKHLPTAPVSESRQQYQNAVNLFGILTNAGQNPGS